MSDLDEYCPIDRVPRKYCGIYGFAGSEKRELETGETREVCIHCKFPVETRETATENTMTNEGNLDYTVYKLWGNHIEDAYVQHSDCGATEYIDNVQAALDFVLKHTKDGC